MNVMIIPQFGEAKATFMQRGMEDPELKKEIPIAKDRQGYLEAQYNHYKEEEKEAILMKREKVVAACRAFEIAVGPREDLKATQFDEVDSNRVLYYRKKNTGFVNVVKPKEIKQKAVTTSQGALYREYLDYKRMNEAEILGDAEFLKILSKLEAKIVKGKVEKDPEVDPEKDTAPDIVIAQVL